MKSYFRGEVGKACNLAAGGVGRIDGVLGISLDCGAAELFGQHD
jgi:hypothetical protein